MEKNQDKQFSPYCVRRLTTQLIKDLTPQNDEKVQKSDGKASSLWDTAKNVGIAIKEIFRAALFQKAPDTKSINRSLKKNEIPNTYGYFLVTITNGKIEVFAEPGAQAPSSGSEMYLVADLVGLPIARITGEFEKSLFSTAQGRLTSAHYAVDLWIDPGISSWDEKDKTNTKTLSVQDQERVGRFIQALMDGRDDLTIAEFCELAGQKLHPVIKNIIDLPTLNSPEITEQAKAKIKEYAVRMLGVTAEVHIRPGSQIFKHQLTLDETTINKIQEFENEQANYLDDSSEYKSWRCPSCSKSSEVQFKFCQECGTPKPSTVKESSQMGRRLVTADGDQLVLDLNFVSYDKPNIDFDGIALKCIEVLRPYARRFPISSFNDPTILSNLASALNNEFSTGTFGPIGEFAIIDYRSADIDWQLQSRAQIKEQLRYISGREAQLQIDEASIALRQAQLTITRLRRGVQVDEAKEELESEKVQVHLEREGKDIELERSNVDAKYEVDLRKISARSEIDQERIEREIERDRKKLDREDFLDTTEKNRDDQLQELDHDMSMENRVLVHDLSKKETLDESQRKTLDKDLEFEERAARLRASRGLDIARSEQDLEIDRKRKEQDINQSEKRLEHEMQLKKLQLMGEIDLQQKEQFKSMTPAQILAMQASTLAEQGAIDALSKLASGDTESQQKFADEKAAMYERMLTMQAASTEQLIKSKDHSEDRNIDLIKTALGIQKESSEKVQQALTRSVQSAELLNKDSMDAMSKVASSASESRGSHKINLNVNDAPQSYKCKNCGTQNSANNKFCGDCGTRSEG